jgi:hypothetical protein
MADGGGAVVAEISSDGSTIATIGIEATARAQTKRSSRLCRLIKLYFDLLPFSTPTLTSLDSSAQHIAFYQSVYSIFIYLYT